MLVSVSWYGDVCCQFLARLMRSYRLTILPRRELRNAAYLLPLAFSNLRRPWSPIVWCVDAAPKGIAAMRSSWAPRSVAEVGRLEERWRWKLTGGIGPGPLESAVADVPDEVVGGEWKNVPKKTSFTFPLVSCLLWSCPRRKRADSSERSRSCAVCC